MNEKTIGNDLFDEEVLLEQNSETRMLGIRISRQPKCVGFVLTLHDARVK